MAKPTQIIFEPEELEIRSVPSGMTREKLLASRGLYNLKDIASLLGIQSPEIKKRAEALQQAGGNPVEVMGVGRPGNSGLFGCLFLRPTTKSI